MLAASSKRSNVSPDYLQAAPLLALTTIAGDELRELTAIGQPEPQPGKPAHKYAAVLQARRDPFLIAIAQVHRAAGQ